MSTLDEDRYSRFRVVDEKTGEMRAARRPPQATARPNNNTVVTNQGPREPSAGMGTVVANGPPRSRPNDAQAAEANSSDSVLIGPPLSLMDAPDGILFPVFDHAVTELMSDELFASSHLDMSPAAAYNLGVEISILLAIAADILHCTFYSEDDAKDPILLFAHAARRMDYYQMRLCPENRMRGRGSPIRLTASDLPALPSSRDGRPLPPVVSDMVQQAQQAAECPSGDMYFMLDDFNRVERALSRILVGSRWTMHGTNPGDKVFVNKIANGVGGEAVYSSRLQEPLCSKMASLRITPDAAAKVSRILSDSSGADSYRTVDVRDSYVTTVSLVREDTPKSFICGVRANMVEELLKSIQAINKSPSLSMLTATVVSLYTVVNAVRLVDYHLRLSNQVR